MGKVNHSVKVGPIIYQVIETRGLVSSEGKKLDGQIDYGGCLIEIEEGIHPQQKALTLAHEIIHAIMFQAGYTEHDESVIDSLAYGWLSVLQDNDLREGLWPV